MRAISRLQERGQHAAHCYYIGIGSREPPIPSFPIKLVLLWLHQNPPEIPSSSSIPHYTLSELVTYLSMADHRVQYQHRQPEATNFSVNTYPGPGPRTHPVYPQSHDHAQRVAVSLSHSIAYQLFTHTFRSEGPSYGR